MIARTWHGLTPLETKTVFRKYLEQTGVRDALALPGNRGAFASVVDQGAYAHFFLCTFWESREDVLAYAGDNPSQAVTYPEDAAFGLISDPIVIHQEVPEARNPFVEGGPRQNFLESASGQRENPPLEAVAETLRAVRQTSPLVHFITNYVTTNDCANITLAAGASPIMADDAREAGQITGLCSALVLNMGTLNERTVQAMLHAGQTANLLGRPVVFDPVGAGASDFRNDTALRLLREIRCAAIKGHNSEISFLDGRQGRGRRSGEPGHRGQPGGKRPARPESGRADRRGDHGQRAHRYCGGQPGGLGRAQRPCHDGAHHGHGLHVRCRDRRISGRESANSPAGLRLRHGRHGRLRRAGL